MLQTFAIGIMGTAFSLIGEMVLQIRIGEY